MSFFISVSMRFNKLIPELYVSDLKESLKFYIDTVGFKVEYERPENKFVFLSLNGAQLMLQEVDESDEPGTPWLTGDLERPFGRGMHFQIEVENADKIADALKKAGYDVRQDIKDLWYRKGDQMVGMRGFLVQDPDGYMFLFNHDLGTRP